MMRSHLDHTPAVTRSDPFLSHFFRESGTFAFATTPRTQELQQCGADVNFAQIATGISATGSRASDADDVRSIKL